MPETSPGIESPRLNQPDYGPSTSSPLVLWGIGSTPDSRVTIPNPVEIPTESGFSPFPNLWATNPSIGDEQACLEVEQGQSQPSLQHSAAESSTRNAVVPRSSRSSQLLQREIGRLRALPHLPDMQIEDVAPWDTISFFVALYLKTLHSLFPLVHKPTFTSEIALRTDQTDRPLRAFILGIGRYDAP